MPDQKDVREIRISPELIEQMMREGIPAVDFDLPADIKLEAVDYLSPSAISAGDGYVTLHVSSDHFPAWHRPNETALSVQVTVRDRDCVPVRRGLVQAVIDALDNKNSWSMGFEHERLKAVRRQLFEALHS